MKPIFTLLIGTILFAVASMLLARAVRVWVETVEKVGEVLEGEVKPSKYKPMRETNSNDL